MNCKIMAIMEALQHWWPYLHSKEFVVHIDHWPWHISLHNQIFLLTNYSGLKILPISFPGVLFNIPRDLLVSF